MNPPAMESVWAWPCGSGPGMCNGAYDHPDIMRCAWSTQTTNQAIGTGARIGRIWGWWALEYSTYPRAWISSAQAAKIGWGAM